MKNWHQLSATLIIALTIERVGFGLILKAEFTEEGTFSQVLRLLRLLTEGSQVGKATECGLGKGNAHTHTATRTRAQGREVMEIIVVWG